ncbi:hypothetical protein PUMCH_004704 [Australozyma saopauloensis]|uniref:Guanine nucleotide-binding protein alpha subunit n=1 Tax=Australozyma saopauloensis TaxID=291208 RepID=A0AAX4HFE6_9ASCO|nr:hypothetical protein PUMCH_004704 [[Candida] saopauloensis]
MGCSASVMTEEETRYQLQKQKSLAIDRALLQKKKEEANLIRIFLLGAGDSGKSTVLKQMRLLHNDSFTDMERCHYTHILWMDMIESMRMLIFNARKYKIPLECDRPNSPLIPFKRIIVETERRFAEEPDDDDNDLGDYAVGYFSQAKPRPKRKDTTDLDVTLLISDSDYEEEKIEPVGRRHSREDIAEAIHQLWNNDRGIKKCYEQRNRFQLETSALYYFEIVHKLKNRMYRCTDKDILMGRIKTTGISEHQFKVKGSVLKLLDAGGQRSERKKWIHHFQHVNAIIFVVAVLEYDQTLYEDGRVSRMEESLSLFDTICNSRWFSNTPFILFLNKVDLLEEKLHKSLITDYCPNYKKDPLDVELVLDYFEKTILSLNRYAKPIYVHRTCATDTAAMKFVLNAVTDMMISQQLTKSGLM